MFTPYPGQREGRINNIHRIRKLDNAGEYGATHQQWNNVMNEHIIVKYITHQTMNECMTAAPSHRR